MVLPIGRSRENDVPRIDVEVHATGSGLARNATGVRIGWLELEGVYATDDHPIEWVSLGIEHVNIDVVVAKPAPVFVDMQHALHRDVKLEAVLGFGR